MTTIIFQKVLHSSLKLLESAHLTEDETNIFCTALSRQEEGHHLLIEFIGRVCDLSWKFTFQKPPMTLRIPDNNAKYRDVQDIFDVLPMKNDDIREVDELRVDYALEPTLMHGDVVMVKGRVKLRQSEISDNEPSENEQVASGRK